jgi:hypothetical protein
MSLDQKLRKRMLTLVASFFLIPSIGEAWHVSERAADGVSAPKDRPPAACRKITDATAKNTPPDLYPSAEKCVRDERYADAAKLLIAARMFGKFDTLRVPDETAHDVAYVLQLHYLQELSDDQRSNLSAALNKTVERGSHALRDLCTDMRRIGYPTYYPAYMVDHGMGSFTRGTDDKSVTSFDGEKAWDKLMADYLHCE